VYIYIYIYILFLIYTCNIVSNIWHLFNLNTDMDGNFHIRDVSSSNALWTIPIGEKVIVEFNGMLQPICTSGLKFRRLGATYV